MGLRIAHVTATFPPYYGGTGNVCFHLARELAWRDHSVAVFTAALRGSSQDEVRDGVHIHRLHAVLRVGNASILSGLIGALRGFDIIHLHYPFFGGEAAALAARWTRTPLVVTYHQDVHLRGGRGLIVEALRQTVGRLTLRAADRLLFTSRDYGLASHARPMLRGREQRIDTLSNGVDLGSFLTEAGAGEIASPGTPGERIVLLVAALDRAHYFKGVAIFLDALRLLPPEIRGIVVGDGDLRQVYEVTASRLGVASRVTFAGRLPKRDLVACYRRADVTVLPSVTMGEAFGMVLLESMACGTPVVASDLPGVRTVVNHGVDGLLVPPDDADALAKALCEMLADRDRLRAMGRRGRAKVAAQYGWSVIGARLEAIYREVLREDSQRPYTRRRRHRVAGTPPVSHS